MTPQTGTLATVLSSPMTPVIRDIALMYSNTASIIRLANTDFPERDPGDTNRVFNDFVRERRLTDDPQACPGGMLAEVDQSRCNRLRNNELLDWGLEPGTSYTYRVGVIYSYSCSWGCVGDPDVVYASAPATVTTPAQLIGKGRRAGPGTA